MVARKSTRASTRTRTMTPRKKRTVSRTSSTKARRVSATSRRRVGARATPARSGKYTRPALRELLKKRLTAGTRGGRAGQWSARKAQLLATEYEKAGGGYRGPKTGTQKSLTAWTREEWGTRTGSTRARSGGTTARYLPKKAWSQLSARQKQATDRRKRVASRRGQQYVANTPAARRARKTATRR
ncbi:hypothetical protein ACN469_39725 [Corallococcus terminator]